MEPWHFTLLILLIIEFSVIPSFANAYVKRYIVDVCYIMCYVTRISNHGPRGVTVVFCFVFALQNKFW